MIKKLAIVAGKGILPILAAEEALAEGHELRIYPVAEELVAENALYDKFASLVTPITITKFGNFLKTLQKDKISHLVFLGKTSKEILFKDFKFDLKAVKILSKMINKNDDSIFYGIEAELSRINIKVLPQRQFLQQLLLKEKVYTRKKPSKKDLKDIKYGMFYSKKIGEIDIGQTVVVRNQSILAVEAIEGTDECIKRGGSLARNKGAVVCKTEKVHQDERFDVPTVGVDTLQIMKESGCHVLAIEAGKTFVVTPQEVIRTANQMGLVVIATKASTTL